MHADAQTGMGAVTRCNVSCLMSGSGDDDRLQIEFVRVFVGEFGSANEERDPEGEI